VGRWQYQRAEGHELDAKWQVPKGDDRTKVVAGRSEEAFGEAHLAPPRVLLCAHLLLQIGGLFGVVRRDAGKIMAAEREGESAVCQRAKYPLWPKSDGREGLSAQVRAIIR
jgi:hypothetical protein